MTEDYSNLTLHSFISSDGKKISRDRCESLNVKDKRNCLNWYTPMRGGPGGKVHCTYLGTKKVNNVNTDFYECDSGYSFQENSTKI